MRKMLLFATVLAAHTVVAACSGGSGGGGGGDDDDDDDGGTPGPGEVRLTIDATPHPDQVALFRLKQQGGGAPPIVCSQTSLDGAGAGVLTSAGLVAGETYDRVQLVLNLDANAVLNLGTDHLYSYATDITVSTTSGVDLTFDHDDPVGTGWLVGAGGPTDPPPQFNWQDGTGCPGE